MLVKVVEMWYNSGDKTWVLKLKRSRIICSIISIIYMLFLLYIGASLVKNTIDVKSHLDISIKLVYLALVALSITVYMILKKRLLKKVISSKLMTLYKYAYLAIITLISRIALVYVLAKKEIVEVVPSYSKGIGSYLNKFADFVIGNEAFANILINTVITFCAVLLIKNILLNITKGDFLSSLAAIVYIFLPQSMYFANEYNRYNFNLIFVLLGVALLMHIIDVVKQYKLKNKKYIYLSIILAIIASIDIILGGTYLFWILFVGIFSLAATYIDIAHISFGQTIKSKVSFKLSKVLYKIEQTNFSKLINTTLIVVAVCGITKLILNICTGSTNFCTFASFTELETRLIDALSVSRNYYIVLISLVLLFEIIGIVLKRTWDIKIIGIKLLNILVIGVMIFSKDLVYTATIFDVTLILLFVSNMCNIYYNREEKIKLLKEKN